MTEQEPAGGSDLLIKRALLSVSDKRGIVALAQALRKFGVEIISTGGTLSTLRQAGIEAKSVSEITGFPEILDGRVKTLHPHVHAAILAALDNPKHVEELRRLGIQPIDLVVVNLYPFEATVSRAGVTEREAIENIDIGGPAMIRASAKNFLHTAVVVNPARYDALVSELNEHRGAITEQTRRQLATEAFQHTAQYDAAIVRHFGGKNDGEDLPPVLMLSEPKTLTLRYGENPHQAAAFYGRLENWIEQLHGKELSYNNILDLHAAVALNAEFDRPAAVIVKHTNPCGVAIAGTIHEAYRLALATDPKSAFGGIVSVNREVDSATAETLNELFLEIVAAPSFSEEALAVLRKKKDRRLIRMKSVVRPSSEKDVRRVGTGYLVQGADTITLVPENVKAVTKRKPTKDEYENLIFAWIVAKHVKSNAIVYVRGERTLGIGAGQMSRVDSSRIAAIKAAEAGHDLNGCAVASDAFFPFADGLLETVKAGATAVIQPGGSVRDEEVIRAADEHNIAMLFTGLRHFRH